MAWRKLGPTLIGLGLRTIGTAIGGRAGAAVGEVIASALDVDATPDAVDRAIQRDPAHAREALEPLETDETVLASYDLASVQLTEVGASMRAESASGDPAQRWWRPALAVFVMIETAVFGYFAGDVLFFGTDAQWERLKEGWPFVMSIFAPQWGLLGYYVRNRTLEKKATVTGDLPRTIIDLIGAMGGR